jgi:hypothetical protein
MKKAKAAKGPAKRRCPDVNHSMATSRPIVPTLHREMARAGLFAPGGRNLDLGGGKYDKATRFVESFGARNLVVDPSRGEPHNRSVWAEVRRDKVDTVTVANVLNVICSSRDRQSLIRAAAFSVRKGGRVGFQVYVGDGSGVGRVTKDGWQENRRPGSYMVEISRWFDWVERRGNIVYALDPRRSPRGPVPPDGPYVSRRSGAR